MIRQIKKIKLEIQLLREHYNNIIECQINDNAMMPYFFQGDIVAGNQYYTSELKSLTRFINKILIIQTVSGDIYVRQLQHAAIKNLYNLFATNDVSASDVINMYDVSIYSIAPILRVYRINQID